MTDQQDLPPPVLAPCPFCSAELDHVAGISIASVWRHPYDDGECVLEGLEFSDAGIDNWNRRTLPTPEVIDTFQDREGRHCIRAAFFDPAEAATVYRILAEGVAPVPPEARSAGGTSPSPKAEMQGGDEALVEAIIERAEQACRYALKHQSFDGDTTKGFREGWEVAAAVCERAIREHVKRHLAADLARALLSAPKDKGGSVGETKAYVLEAARNFLENPEDGNAADFVKMGDLRAVCRALLAKDKAAWSEMRNTTLAKLWLWKNGDHYWAFDNLYPCVSADGDPLTLGEPVGYALLKPSVPRREAEGDCRETTEAKVARETITAESAATYPEELADHVDAAIFALKENPHG